MTITPQALEAATRQLVQARASGQRIAPFDAAIAPTTLADAHAIQDATVARLEERVGGWKVAAPVGGQLARGVILGSRLLASPARLPSSLVPLLAVEAEIAFRFDRGLPARAAAYSPAEVADAATAVAAIEVVDSRFADYGAAPLLDRIADCVSNGAFVVGETPADWRAHDLSKLEVTLCIDGKEIVRSVGGHPTGDPMLRTVELVNLLRSAGGIQPGQVVTTGTYTGLNRAGPGQTVTVDFIGFGKAEVAFS
ncbi:fumarylacetoacetate hydrolase family protein [Variovorax sp. dw_954]|uniref:2-keto-4-pentenoate hydratase n=1 Tax=Variovorax sp. dw_954 TaxID=2720078 RepID=UPI001BD5046B|nr:fumarylacetoacetate hydrolase family protein [Variovorax sp. dw_954]